MLIGINEQKIAQNSLFCAKISKYFNKIDDMSINLIYFASQN